MDGYPFYPGVARNLCLKHKLGDHRKEFKSLSDTIPIILWVFDLIKKSMEKKHNVMEKTLLNGL